jgi:hypothetical protein
MLCAPYHSHVVFEGCERVCHVPCACTNIQNVGSRSQLTTIRKFARDVPRQ